MNAAFQRALILHQQGRHTDAERELRQVLAGDPHDAHAHAMLSLCLVEQEKLQEATREAGDAIGLAPDMDFGHYAMARVMLERNRFAEAEAAAMEAIRLNSTNPDYFAILASVRINQRRWPSALETANEGLKFDPEHAGCNNLRAMALVQLGRRDEAGLTIGDALANDPDNAVTHANQGWALLHRGEHTKAMEHFREALRLDPTLDWARAGIVEALKARFFIYRWLLMYFLWMSRLSSRAQWGIVLGGYFGSQLLRSAARQNPAIGPYVWPIIGVYIAFAVLTWLANPLFNLLLRLNRFGKLALSREQVMTSNLIGLLLLAGITFVVLALTMHRGLFVDLALVFGLLLLPSSVILRCDKGWPRTVMILGTSLLALIGFTYAAMFEIAPEGSPLARTASGVFTLFLFGAIASQFVASWLVGVRARR